MRDLRRPVRPLLLAVSIAALVAIPVLAVGPRGTLTSPSPAAPSSVEPAASSTSDATKPPSRPTASISASPERSAPPAASHGAQSGEPDGEQDEDGSPVTVTGTIGTRTEADGESEYTLTSGSTTYVLEAGPKWFYGAKHPLQPFVGKRVTVVGEQATGSNELEVRSVDGTVIRGDGKPPWAGGWKRVGKVHPGWSQEKWDRWQARMAGPKTP